VFALIERREMGNQVLMAGMVMGDVLDSSSP